MKELTAALADEFGTARIFRPHRDVRFSKDKQPFKTHQGAFVSIGPETGYYVEVSPRGSWSGSPSTPPAPEPPQPTTFAMNASRFTTSRSARWAMVNVSCRAGAPVASLLRT